MRQKASERLNYFLSDVWDNTIGFYNWFVKWFLITNCAPLAIIALISVIAGGCFHYDFVFSPFFYNIPWYWIVANCLIMPILIPFAWLCIVFFVLGVFVRMVFDSIINFFK